MWYFKRIGCLLSLMVGVLLGPGVAAHGQDLITPIYVHTSCEDFPDYALGHLGDAASKVGATASDVGGHQFWGITVLHALEPIKAWRYDIYPNANRTFHCACSGKDVDNYAVECPTGMKCFGDSFCPAGQDCENHFCGRAHMIKFDVVASVDSAFFQWSPQPVLEQCQETMSAWNDAVRQHEMSHVTDDHVAVEVYEAEGLKLQTPEECSPDQGALKMKLDKDISDMAQALKKQFDENQAGLSDALHHAIGKASPPPDCACERRPVVHH